MNCFKLLWSVVPLVADVSDEDIVMRKVDVEIIVEGNKFILGDCLVVANDEREEVLSDLIGRHLLGLVRLDNAGVEMLH